jgi:chromosome segregation ATPase
VGEKETNMADLEKAITTQEQLDEVMRDRLAREAKKYEGYTSPKDLEELKAGYDKKIGELNGALTSANEKASKYDKDIAERDAKIKGYETDSVKTRIAHEEGLPYGMSKRLSGETEDDIRKDAKALHELMNMGGGTQPLAEPEKTVTQTDANNAALKGMLQKMTE